MYIIMLLLLRIVTYLLFVVLFKHFFYFHQELPQEAKRFTRIDKGWTKMMKRAYDTRNVLQVRVAGLLLFRTVYAYLVFSSSCHVFCSCSAATVKRCQREWF